MSTIREWLSKRKFWATLFGIESLLLIFLGVLLFAGSKAAVDHTNTLEFHVLP